MRRGRRQQGFTLVEVLVALMIVATTIGALQLVAGRALKSAAETNKVRVAKMLLLAKAEEVVAGIEEGTGGEFEGYPGFSWDVYDQLVPLEDVEEQVRSVTVSVRYPTLVSRPEDDFEDLDGVQRDAAGQLRVTVLVDPPDAELKPPPGAGQAQGPGR